MNISYMKLPINATYIITDIEIDKHDGKAQVYVNDVFDNTDYIVNYDIDGDFDIQYDKCGSGEREVSLCDTDLVFVDVVDYLNLDEVELTNLDIAKVTQYLESYIIDVLEQEKIDDLHSDYIGY